MKIISIIQDEEISEQILMCLGLRKIETQPPLTPWSQDIQIGQLTNSPG